MSEKNCFAWLCCPVVSTLFLYEQKKGSARLLCPVASSLTISEKKSSSQLLRLTIFPLPLHKQRKNVPSGYLVRLPPPDLIKKKNSARLPCPVTPPYPVRKKKRSARLLCPVIFPLLIHKNKHVLPAYLVWLLPSLFLKQESARLPCLVADPCPVRKNAPQPDFFHYAQDNTKYYELDNRKT
jgi:hypothetical protein